VSQVPSLYVSPVVTSLAADNLDNLIKSNQSMPRLCCGASLALLALIALNIGCRARPSQLCTDVGPCASLLLLGGALASVVVAVRQLHLQGLDLEAIPNPQDPQGRDIV
jgi:hypothetical protein